jgi:hypothetical protein
MKEIVFFAVLTGLFFSCNNGRVQENGTESAVLAVSENGGISDDTDGEKINVGESTQALAPWDTAPILEVSVGGTLSHDYQIYRDQSETKIVSGGSYWVGSRNGGYLTIDGMDSNIYSPDDEENLPKFVYDQFNLKQAMRQVLWAECTNWATDEGFGWINTELLDGIQPADEEVLSTIIRTLFALDVLAAREREKILVRQYTFEHKDHPELNGRYLLVYVVRTPDRALVTGVKL